MPKRGIRQFVLRRERVGITSSSVPFRLRSLQIEFSAASLFLCLKGSLERETLVVVQSIRSITLVLLSFLMKRPRLILLTSLTRLKISTL
jgi:hypothetical protein